MNKSIFLCTGGRCGTHWVRHILSQTLDLVVGLYPFNPNLVPFKTEPKFIWSIKMKEKRDPGGNIYVGHLPINNLLPIINIVNIIFLIRDPRDMCVSAAYYNLYQDMFPEVLFKKRLLSLLYQGGPNADFNDSCIEYKDKIPHVLLKYEEMVEDSYEAVKKVLKSFEYDYDDNKLKEALEENTFKKLSGGRGVGEEDNTAFYRKGIVGDWKNYLTNDMNIEFNKRHKVLLKEWGYV